MSAPFEAIPAEAAGVLRPVLPTLADEIIAAIAVEVPEYARAMEGPFGQAVRRGVELALGRFVDALLTPAAAERGARDETYVELGRGEMRVGRSLDALLSAYRVGARVAWRRFVETGVEGGLPPATLYRLGEAIFAYIDAISAESAAGFAEEQSARPGERQRRRRALVRLLAGPSPRRRGVDPDRRRRRRVAPAARGRRRGGRRRSGGRGRRGGGADRAADRPDGDRRHGRRSGLRLRGRSRRAGAPRPRRPRRRRPRRRRSGPPSGGRRPA